MVCLFIALFGEHCRSDDSSLSEKIWIKPHLKPQDLQGELRIMIFFLLNPIQTGGGFSNPPLRQSRNNFYTERAMTFKFSDFS